MDKSNLHVFLCVFIWVSVGLCCVCSSLVMGAFWRMAVCQLEDVQQASIGSELGFLDGLLQGVVSCISVEIFEGYGLMALLYGWLCRCMVCYCVYAVVTGEKWSSVGPVSSLCFG